MASFSKLRSKLRRLGVSTPAKKKKAKLSRTTKPEGMTVEAWQRELRRQFGRDQKFQLKNLGEHPIFSEFLVSNPASRNAYRVAIRGCGAGDNFCTCPDFATNTLGTCKHVEFVLSRLEKRSGGKRALQDGFQPKYSEVFLNYGAQREVKFQPGTQCPVELARLASEYFDETGVIRSDSFQKFEHFLAECGQLEHELRCRDDALSFIAQVRDDERRRKAILQMFPKGIRSSAFEQLISATLYDYQRQGALFAAMAGRSIIGDEMGLGKTVQAIACAEILSRTSGVEKVLIICPTSLKHQWEREIQKFTRRSVTVIAGNAVDRAAMYQQNSFYTITNYDTVHRDLSAIRTAEFDFVILDEAQRIKNWETRTAITVKKIMSPYGLMLTGTPLENRLEELVSIVQFVDIHRFGPTFRFLDEHQIKDKFGRVVGYQRLDKINKTLEPILIRRRKETVLDQLPERIENIFFVPMTAEQNEIHKLYSDMLAAIVQRWRRIGFLTDTDQRRLMMCLQNMRMSCDSSYLVDGETKFDRKPDEIAEHLDDIFENSDCKVVIFSQWLKMHELLIERLQQRKIGFAFFHGGVDSAKRKQLIDRFRDDNDCKVFLATDAGSVGLNLQFANVVINADLPWNPAVLEQRIGRVHRLGQKKTVQVFNFVSKGSIEEGMLSVIRFKKKMFAGVLDGGEKEVFLGGSRLKQFIETVEKVSANISPSIPDEGDLSGQKRITPAEQTGKKKRPLATDGHVRDSDQPAVAPSSSTEPLGQLLKTGMELLSAFLAPAIHAEGPSLQSEPRQIERKIHVMTDPATGAQSLNIPVPNAGLLQQMVNNLQSILEQVKRE